MSFHVPKLAKLEFIQRAGEQTFHAEFSNRYHMEVVIHPPYGPEQIANALVQLAREVVTNPALAICDEWTSAGGEFYAGERVRGSFGEGTVATRDYCMGRGPEFEGKIVERTGIRRNLIPVIYDSVGCFWESYVTRI